MASLVTTALIADYIKTLMNNFFKVNYVACPELDNYYKLQLPGHVLWLRINRSTPDHIILFSNIDVRFATVLDIPLFSAHDLSDIEQKVLIPKNCNIYEIPSNLTVNGITIFDPLCSNFLDMVTTISRQSLDHKFCRLYSLSENLKRTYAKQASYLVLKYGDFCLRTGLSIPVFCEVFFSLYFGNFQCDYHLTKFIFFDSSEDYIALCASLRSSFSDRVHEIPSLYLKISDGSILGKISNKLVEFSTRNPIYTLYKKNAQEIQEFTYDWLLDVIQQLFYYVSTSETKDIFDIFSSVLHTGLFN